MKLVTERYLIKNVVNMLNRCWPPSYKGLYKPRVILAQLKALDLNTATKKEVDSIIGESTWTETYCDNCQRKCSTYIDLGYNNHFCIKCARKLAALIPS